MAWLKDLIQGFKEPRVVIQKVEVPVPFEVPVEKVVYRVVEVKQSNRLIREWDKETRDAVSTLPSHPGFVALMDKLALQKQQLESKLSREFRKDQRESDYLQAGVFWLGYLSDTVAKATRVPRQAQTNAFDAELEAFKEIDSQIERVGM